MNMDELVKRINELAHKAKTEGPTEDETKERAVLREQYIAAFRKNLCAQLDNTYIIEPDGTKHSYLGMTDVGRKPTVQPDSKRVSVETFVYDFDGDLYGKTIRVELLTFERPEQKFASFDALKQRILQDVEAGRVYFQKQDDSSELEPGEPNADT